MALRALAALLATLAKVVFVVSGQRNDFDPPIQIKIDNLKMYTNISDLDLLIDPKSFVREHKNKSSLRLSPRYFDPKEPLVKAKAIDLMKQAIYATQTRLRDLDKVLEKYKDDVGMRMAFISGRLDQLLIDIRRIYTLSRKQTLKKKVYQHIILYEFCARKHVDVIYLVEHAIAFHTDVMVNKGYEIMLREHQRQDRMGPHLPHVHHQHQKPQPSINF